MSYQFIDESGTTIKIIVGTDELLFKKVYCSTAYEGDYFILNTHELESSKYRQEFKLLYTDCTNPSAANASALKTAVDAIIDNYAGGGGGGYVPYTGATGDVDLGTHGLITDFVEFSLSPTASPGAGQIAYNGATGSLAYLMNSSNVQSEIGQTLHAYVHNAESVTITKGQAVYLYQASGNKASVKLAYNTSDDTSAKTFGLAAEDISAGQKGFVMCQGSLEGLNTGAYTAGDTLYLGATAGSLTSTKPSAPNHLVYIGVVERANAGNGQIYVRPQNGYELSELHDVQANSPTNKDTLYFDSADSQWKTASLTTILGYTPLLGVNSYRKSGRWYTNSLFGPSNGAINMAANSIQYVPFWVDSSFTLTGLGINVTTAGSASSTARIGIYNNNSSTTAPSTLVVDSGTIAVSTTGAKSVTGLSVALTKGLYWMAFFTNSTAGAITALGNDRSFDIRGLASIGGSGWARYSQILTYTSLPANAGTLTDNNATTTYCIYYTF